MFRVIKTRLRLQGRAWIEAHARSILSERQALWAPLPGEVEALQTQIKQAHIRISQDIERLDRQPFTLATPIHVAWRRHPGVGAVFRRYGLPRCLDCAVGADETVAEAALSEGFSASQLLEELNALLRV
jgi:hypothetical protein